MTDDPPLWPAGNTPDPARAARLQSSAVLFIQTASVGLWQVCFGNVLKAHGLEFFIPYAFACLAISAFISPMFIGALADQHIAPARLLRWLSFAAAGTLALTFLAIERAWSPLLVLATLQVHALCATPTGGLATSIILSRLREPSREFGPIRVWATLGWTVAGWTISWVLVADASTRSGFAAAWAWIITACVTFLLPNVAPPTLTAPRTWASMSGFSALKLLGDRDHGAVFVTAALFSIPLAAGNPFLPVRLEELGIRGVTAAMTLAQYVEIVSMFTLGFLFRRVRMKWIFFTGISFGMFRFLSCAIDTRNSVLLGAALQGIAYPLYFITAQIYIEERVAPTMRARSQALLVLMMNGFGSLIGCLGSAWWRHVCTADGQMQWPKYWNGLAAACVLVLGFFFSKYRGVPRPVLSPLAE